MICKHCGIEFTGRKRKYCSAECCKLAHGQNPNYKPETHCLVCGKPLLPGQKKHCSSTCDSRAYYRRKHPVPAVKIKKDKNKEEARQRQELTDRIVKRNIYISLNKKIKGTIAYRDITPEMIIENRAQILAWRERKANPPSKPPKPMKYCRICGMESKNGVYCSDECKRVGGRNRYYANREELLSKARDKYEPIPKVERICKQCGNPFIGYKKDIYCSDTCRHKAKQEQKAKRRATKLNVHYEPVNPLMVFKRDGWRCQLCGKKLKPKHRGTIRDDAPELDHIIPWAQGGEHSYRNTQCACRKCNQEKGARELGQLRLFG